MISLPKEHIYTEDDYWQLPENIRAELIDGHLYYMAAPSRIHQNITGRLYALILDYIRSKHGSCHVYQSPFAVKPRKDRDNIVEPDISVICDRSKLTDTGCTGAPDWIVEIVSPSNPGNDYVRKLNLYADAGVCEYWIVDPMEKSVFVYQFGQAHFKAVAYSFQDIIHVSIYDDLSIDFDAMIDEIQSAEL